MAETDEKNKSSKMRASKMRAVESNIFTELATLLPIAQDKKYDKMTVLRLLVAYLNCRSAIEKAEDEHNKILRHASEHPCDLTGYSGTLTDYGGEAMMDDNGWCFAGADTYDTSDFLDDLGDGKDGLAGALENLDPVAALGSAAVTEDPETQKAKLERYKEEMERGMREFLGQNVPTSLGGMEAGKGGGRNCVAKTGVTRGGSSPHLKHGIDTLMYVENLDTETKGSRSNTGDLDLSTSGNNGRLVAPATSCFRFRDGEFPSIEDEVQLMLDAARGFLLMLDNSMEIIFVSENVSQFIGYTQAQLIGQNICKFIHERDIPDLERYMHKGKALNFKPDDARMSFFMELKYCFPKKSTKYKLTGNSLFQWNYRLTLGQNPVTGQVRVDGLISLCRQINVNSIPFVHNDGTRLQGKLNLDFSIVALDPRLELLTGYNPDEMKNHDPYLLKHPCDVFVVYTQHRDLLLKGTSQSGYYRIINKFGNWMWTFSQMEVITNSQNKPKYIALTCHIISPRVAENALKEDADEFKRFKCEGFGKAFRLNQEQPGTTDGENTKLTHNEMYGDPSQNTENNKKSKEKEATLRYEKIATKKQNRHKKPRMSKSVEKSSENTSKTPTPKDTNEERVDDGNNDANALLDRNAADVPTNPLVDASDFLSSASSPIEDFDLLSSNLSQCYELSFCNLNEPTHPHLRSRNAVSFCGSELSGSPSENSQIDPDISHFDERNQAQFYGHDTVNTNEIMTKTTTPSHGENTFVNNDNEPGVSSPNNILTQHNALGNTLGLISRSASKKNPPRQDEPVIEDVVFGEVFGDLLQSIEADTSQDQASNFDDLLLSLIGAESLLELNGEIGSVESTNLIQSYPNTSLVTGNRDSTSNPESLVNTHISNTMFNQDSGIKQTFETWENVALSTANRSYSQYQTPKQPDLSTQLTHSTLANQTYHKSSSPNHAKHLKDEMMTLTNCYWSLNPIISGQLPPQPYKTMQVKDINQSHAYPYEQTQANLHNPSSSSPFISNHQLQQRHKQDNEDTAQDQLFTLLKSPQEKDGATRRLNDPNFPIEHSLRLENFSYTTSVQQYHSQASTAYSTHQLSKSRVQQTGATQTNQAIFRDKPDTPDSLPQKHHTQTTQKLLESGEHGSAYIITQAQNSINYNAQQNNSTLKSSLTSFEKHSLTQTDEFGYNAFSQGHQFGPPQPHQLNTSPSISTQGLSQSTATNTINAPTIPNVPLESRDILSSDWSRDILSSDLASVDVNDMLLLNSNIDTSLNMLLYNDNLN